MADTQSAPQPAPGSIAEAEEVLLGLLEPEKEKPETEETTPT